jgi:hypothetical protein
VKFAAEDDGLRTGQSQLHSVGLQRGWTKFLKYQTVWHRVSCPFENPKSYIYVTIFITYTVRVVMNPSSILIKRFLFIYLCCYGKAHKFVKVRHIFLTE